MAERIEKAREAPSFEVRHNPCACACPAWEMRLDGVWQRVAFDVSDQEEDATLLALQAELAKPVAPGQPPPTWRIQGQLDDGLDVCARGAVYVTFVPSAFGEPPAPEGQVDGDEQD